MYGASSLLTLRAGRFLRESSCGFYSLKAFRVKRARPPYMVTMKDSDKSLPATFPGHRYRRAVQGAVDAILLPSGISRRVVSRGSQFFNVDHWTGLRFCENLCEHLGKNPDRAPNSKELSTILTKTNSGRCRNPYIQVAAIPDQVSQRVALALIGGGYHEAWHTKYSKRTDVQPQEVSDALAVIQSVLDEGGQWDAKMRGLLKTLQHVVEDIRIERCGNQEFPGALQPMRDLQDFILDNERERREKKSQRENVTVSSNARSVLICCLRDLGLGYNTQAARDMIEYYKETSPEAVELCSPGGALAPLLHEAKTLSAKDEMGCLRIAAEMVATLWRISNGKQPAPSNDLMCPNCGEGPGSLILRAVKDEEGRKVRGQAEQECKECGYKVQFPLPDTSLEMKKPQQPEEADGEEAERPEVEDLSWEDVEGSDGFQQDDRELLRDLLRGQSSSEDKREEGDHEDLTVVSVSNPNRVPEEEGAGSLPGVAEGAGMWEVDGETYQQLTSPWNSPVGGPGPGSGKDPASYFDLAEQILKGDEEDDRVQADEALSSAVESIMEAMIASLRDGEKLWNPPDPSRDIAHVVKSRNRSLDTQRASDMLTEVRSTVAYLRARLRSIVRAQEMTSVIHGVPRGKKLSDRKLASTVCDLKSGEMPRQAYQTKTTKVDTSLALVSVLDQSYSMSGSIRSVVQCAMALTDAVEGIKGKSMSFGFRSGSDLITPGIPEEDYDAFDYHRYHNVYYDVFKQWDEPFVSSKWRFARATVEGGTPMADGIQYGLCALNERREKHRIMVVITDGAPDPGHLPVINRQLRLAKEAGIHVLGVGFGSQAKYVKKVFPDYVHVPTVTDLPQPLLKKLNDLCDFHGNRRGRQAKLDGKVSRRIS